MNKREVDVKGVDELITSFILKVLGCALGLIIGGIIVSARPEFGKLAGCYMLSEKRGGDKTAAIHYYCFVGGIDSVWRTGVCFR